MALSGLCPSDGCCSGMRIGHRVGQKVISRGRMCWGPPWVLGRLPPHRTEPLALRRDALLVVEQAIELAGAPFGGATRRLWPHGPVDHSCSPGDERHCRAAFARVLLWLAEREAGNAKGPPRQVPGRAFEGLGAVSSAQRRIHASRKHFPYRLIILFSQPSAVPSGASC